MTGLPTKVPKPLPVPLLLATPAAGRLATPVFCWNQWLHWNSTPIWKSFTGVHTVRVLTATILTSMLHADVSVMVPPAPSTGPAPTPGAVPEVAPILPTGVTIGAAPPTSLAQIAAVAAPL